MASKAAPKSLLLSLPPEIHIHLVEAAAETSRPGLLNLILTCKTLYSAFLRANLTQSLVRQWVADRVSPFLIEGMCLLTLQNVGGFRKDLGTIKRHLKNNVSYEAYERMPLDLVYRLLRNHEIILKMSKMRMLRQPVFYRKGAWAALLVKRIAGHSILGHQAQESIVHGLYCWLLRNVTRKSLDYGLIVIKHILTLKSWPTVTDENDDELLKWEFYEHVVAPSKLYWSWSSTGDLSYRMCGKPERGTWSDTDYDVDTGMPVGMHLLIECTTVEDLWRFMQAKGRRQREAIIKELLEACECRCDGAREPRFIKW